MEVIFTAENINVTITQGRVTATLGNLTRTTSFEELLVAYTTGVTIAQVETLGLRVREFDADTCVLMALYPNASQKPFVSLCLRPDTAHTMLEGLATLERVHCEAILFGQWIQ